MLEALIAAIGQSAKAQGNTFWTRKLTMGTPAQVHLAVMVEPYLSRVLDGSKTIESRFSRKKIAPWGRVSSGDVVVLKKSGGSFVAVFETTDATYVELSPRQHGTDQAGLWSGPLRGRRLLAGQGRMLLCDADFHWPFVCFSTILPCVSKPAVLGGSGNVHRAIHFRRWTPGGALQHLITAVRGASFPHGSLLYVV